MSHTAQELQLLQALPLDIKILKTKQRIREWVGFYGLDDVAVSFSGGKDSTVLLDIARQEYPDIKGRFVNTGLEYPEIVSFVKTFENIKILRPKMTFPEVIKKYGYPFISKGISNLLFYARKEITENKGSKQYYNWLTGVGKDKNGQSSIYNCKKYEPLLYLPIIFGNQCCNMIKKNPFAREKAKAITGSQASESRLRTQKWLKSGCNAFDSKKPISNPMSFWTEQDVLTYIKDNNLKIASVYGEVVEVDNMGEVVFGGCGKELRCSGVDRTGCVFCGFGCHLDTQKGGISRFVRLKETHPKLYDYCMGGGEFVEGIWKPSTSGLGMRYVIEELNKIYDKKLKDGTIKKFIEY
jgi:3'-phosphoadenosine 5'-phosphosulfate sulfotransferase (PAPS reductase)/FAD synthetase